MFSLSSTTAHISSGSSSGSGSGYGNDNGTMAMARSKYKHNDLGQAHLAQIRTHIPRTCFAHLNCRPLTFGSGIRKEETYKVGCIEYQCVSSGCILEEQDTIGASAGNKDAIPGHWRQHKPLPNQHYNQISKPTRWSVFLPGISTPAHYPILLWLFATHCPLVIGNHYCPWGPQNQRRYQVFSL